jgi:hypothetical protein
VVRWRKRGDWAEVGERRKERGERRKERGERRKERYNILLNIKEVVGSRE